MLKHPKIFVVQELSIELMNKDIDVADWMKMLERELNNLDARGNIVRQFEDALLSDLGQKRILFNSVDLSGPELCHFD